VNNYTKITFMKIKMSAIDIFLLAFTSLILITGSPFQIANNLVENNELLPIKYFGKGAYAEDNGNDGVDEGSSDREEMKIDNSGQLIKSEDYKSQEKEICKNHDGEWLITFSNKQ
jgi:hypothetical protein